MKKLPLILVLFPSVVLANSNKQVINQTQTNVVIINNQPATNGKDGKDGVNGQDYNGDHRLNTNIGADIQWYDWEHASIRSGYRYDFNHKGHVVDIGVLTVKIGKSYETRQLEAMRKKIEILNSRWNVVTVPEIEPLKSVIRGNQ